MNWLKNSPWCQDLMVLYWHTTAINIYSVNTYFLRGEGERSRKQEQERERETERARKAVLNSS